MKKLSELGNVLTKEHQKQIKGGFGSVANCIAAGETCPAGYDVIFVNTAGGFGYCSCSLSPNPWPDTEEDQGGN